MGITQAVGLNNSIVGLDTSVVSFLISRRNQMKSDKKSTKSYLLTIVILLVIIIVIGVGALAYTLGSSGKQEPTNTYKQKSDQINSCVQSSPPITDTGNLEENYRKQQEYCANLYR